MRVLRVASVAALLLASRLLAELEVAPDAFVDITRNAGIAFTHNNGATSKKFLPETMGSGVAFLDVDNDDLQDLLFVNGRSLPGSPVQATTLRLYRNSGNRTFQDITARSGLDVSVFGMGVAAADYDNDGFIDVYITALEGDRLFRNNGKGAFADVTRSAGIQNASFGTSAAWLDYDRDGDVDLFVANYVEWTPQTDVRCTLDGKTKSYCTPEVYKGTASKLYRNRGNGTFEDVGRAAGIHDVTSKSLGLTVVDFDMDGWPDIAVANDTQPNKLYRNLKNGRFREEGVASGIAFSEDGLARGAMGIDWADYDRSGKPSLAIGNFAGQMLGLYHNEGNGLFVDEAPQKQIGRQSLLSLAFGLFFFDADLDGQVDLFVANGHIERDIEKIQPRVKYKQPPHLFRNLGNGRFEDIAPSMQGSLGRPVVGRGAAYGDIDNDGSLDVVVTTNGGPAYLYRNQSTGSNHALRIRAAGTRANRSAIGARVRVQSSGAWQWQEVKSGSSYCSQSELPLTFGLGPASRADVVEVHWPGGAVERFSNIPADTFVTVREGSGIVDRRPLAARTGANR